MALNARPLDYHSTNTVDSASTKCLNIDQIVCGRLKKND